MESQLMGVSKNRVGWRWMAWLVGGTASVGHLETQISSPLFFYHTLRYGWFSLCCPCPSLQRDRSVHSTSQSLKVSHHPFFHFQFVHENLVPWPYPGEREAGKWHLTGCWAIIMEEGDDCLCHKSYRWSYLIFLIYFYILNILNILWGSFFT